MRDFFLPTTDGGVAAQFVGFALLAPIALYAARRTQAKLLVTGVVVFTFAFMMLRMVH